MKNKKNKEKKQQNKKTIIAILIPFLVLFIFIIGISIKLLNINKDYDNIAKSSYNAMKDYLKIHPYDRSVTLEKLEKGNYLNNRKDPKSKEKYCTGKVDVEIRNASSEKLVYDNYTVYLCCNNYSKKYTYPNNKVEELNDKNKCNIEHIEQSLDTDTIKCNKGEYLRQGESQCEPCLNSHYCPGGSFNINSPNNQGIIPCPEGYNNSEVGSSKEKQCFMTIPENNYIKKSKDKTPTVCENNQLKESHNVYYGDISSCTPKKITVTFDCNSGTGGGTQTFTTGIPNQKLTKKCTKSGKIQDGWKRKKNASSRDYTMNNEITDSWILKNTPKITLYANWKNLSIKCNEGTYIKRNETTCSKCLENYYCPGGSYTLNTNNNQGLKKCPTGYTNSKEGSTKKEQCYMTVEEGKYIKEQNDSSTTKCESGTYKEEHIVYFGSTSSCNNCPTGYSNSKEGSTKKEQCYMKVPKDQYIKNKKDSEGTPCPDGYEIDSHTVYYNSTSTCNIKTNKCNPGEYLKKSTATCTICPRGNYCKGGAYKFSENKDQGINKCPNGYSNSKEGSIKKSDCYMSVPKNKYVRKKNDSSPTKCPKDTTLKAHNVKYGRTSRPCNCSTAPNVTCSTSITGGFKCLVDDEKIDENGASFFNISGCTSGLNGFVCYHNPNGSNCVGKEFYSNNAHYDNGFGHIAFKKDKWAYYKSTKQAWAIICNENKCSNYYKTY